MQWFPKHKRRLSMHHRILVVHGLFSGFMLSFLFEGRVLYALLAQYELSFSTLIFGAIGANFLGMLLCPFFLASRKEVKKLYLGSLGFYVVLLPMFFFPPNALWLPFILVASFLAGGLVSGWGFFLRDTVPKKDRMKVLCDLLILSNVVMLLLNVSVVFISPVASLWVSMGLLLLALYLSNGLEVEESLGVVQGKVNGEGKSPLFPLVYLILFITLITVNSGLMYQVVVPSFAHLDTLTSWYFPVPYMGALLFLRFLPKGLFLKDFLYVAVAMMGLSFVAFMVTEPTVLGYFLVNTLMLSSFGIFDLFWWSILGEMLELQENPSRIFGFGLAANLLGIFLGGSLGVFFMARGEAKEQGPVLALGVVFVSLGFLPFLHRQLRNVLKDHAFLQAFATLTTGEQESQGDKLKKLGALSERESQVAMLLLKGKTYKNIGLELSISENTVKYYVKNIYAKFEIQSRAELISLMESAKG